MKLQISLQTPREHMPTTEAGLYVCLGRAPGVPEYGLLCGTHRAIGCGVRLLRRLGQNRLCSLLRSASCGGHPWTVRPDGAATPLTLWLELVCLTTPVQFLLERGPAWCGFGTLGDA